MSKSKKKVICFITSSRADYGLFSRLILLCKKSFVVKIVVTGSHLSQHHGYTYNQIKNNGFKNIYRIKIQEKNHDKPNDISFSISKTIEKFSKFFETEYCDLVVVIGDRYEIFSAVTAATIRRLPIAHIHGGELTSNAYDEYFRHSITIMSQIHFVAAKKYFKRVMQLGKNPKNIYLVGSLGVSNIKNIKIFLTKKEIEKKISIRFAKRNIFFLFHPETLEYDYGLCKFKNTIDVLKKLRETNIIAVTSNSDTNYLKFNRILEKESKTNKNFYYKKSINSQEYFSLLRHCDMIIGNSSGGIIEAPSLFIPTINIGQRQHGRLRARTIIDVNKNKKEISSAIKKSFILKNKIKKNKFFFRNPYDRGDTAKKIYKILCKKKTFNNLNIKKFYDLKLNKL
jgi:GDP/UDP-N,N'-diacetylbacillosamine 2-epimerase (hydrolysing)